MKWRLMMEAVFKLAGRKGTLDEKTGMVLVQFHMADIDKVSSEIRQILEEVEQNDNPSQKRKIPAGSQFVQPTDRTAVIGLMPELESSGYSMVDAYYQYRANAEGYGHYIVRFIFCPETETTIENADKRQYLRESRVVLDLLCRGALWGVRAFCNPLLKDEVIVDGRCALSINLSSRMPFKDGAGNPILERPLDQTGRRKKDAKAEPLRASFTLTADGEIKILPAD